MVPSPATYNPSWSYHYSPATVEFFDFTVEVRDTTTSTSRNVWTRTAAPFFWVTPAAGGVRSR
ncbi:BP74-related protein [Sphaerisporangium krabiense]|uniref:BP74-related protein n=1 Tax=Sphaerisporangium krabiense TaxID=763782 RepID=UPI003FD762EF